MPRRPVARPLVAGWLAVTLVVSGVAAVDPISASASPARSRPSVTADPEAANPERRLTVPGGAFFYGASYSGMTPDGGHVFVGSNEPLDGGPEPTYSQVFDIVAGRAIRLSPGIASHVWFRGATPDGSIVVLDTPASLSPMDGDANPDLYRSDGSGFRLISVGASRSRFHGISADGSVVVFSTADSLKGADGDSLDDLYAWQADTGALTLLTTGTSEAMNFLALSAGGTKVLFQTSEELAGSGIPSSSGEPGIYQSIGGTLTFRGAGVFRSATADIDTVAFRSGMSFVAGDTDGAADPYVHDSGGFRVLGEATEGPVDLGPVSDDGSRALLLSESPLTPDDLDTAQDVFLLEDGGLTMVSLGAEPSGTVKVDANWNTVVYRTRAALVAADQDSQWDVYAWDRVSPGAPRLLSPGTGDFEAAAVHLSDDGQRVLLQTEESLLASDSDTFVDLYEVVGADVALLTPDTGRSWDLEAVTPDGMRVIIEAPQPMDAADTNLAWDIYLSDADLVGPSVNVGSPPSPITSRSASIAFEAAGADAIWFDCALDGTAWSRCRSPIAFDDLPDGHHQLIVRGWDAAGNVGSDSAVWRIDTIGPTVAAPIHAMVVGAIAGKTTVPARLSWSGTDGGSGIASYEIAGQTDGGTWKVFLPRTRTTALNVALESGHTYRFRVRAFDVAGNSTVSYGPTFALTVHEESSPSITWTGVWQLGADAVFHGGASRYATAQPAAAELAFVGSTVAWIGSVGPTRGSVNVYIDGALIQTVSLYSATTAHRQVLFVRSWPTFGTHKVTLRVVGTPGHPRADLDALVTWK